MAEACSEKKLPVRESRPDDMVEMTITFSDPDLLSLRKRIHRLWCKSFWDSPYPGLEGALEDLFKQAAVRWGMLRSVASHSRWDKPIIVGGVTT